MRRMRPFLSARPAVEVLPACSRVTALAPAPPVDKEISYWVNIHNKKIANFLRSLFMQ